MSENIYERGELIRVTASFTLRSSGAALDPTTVKLSVRVPDGTVTTYVYGTDAALIKDSTGHYHYDLSLASVGRYYYRWWSTGNGQAADEKSIRVKESKAV